MHVLCLKYAYIYFCNQEKTYKMFAKILFIVTLAGGIDLMVSVLKTFNVLNIGLGTLASLGFLLIFAFVAISILKRKKNKQQIDINNH